MSDRTDLFASGGDSASADVSARTALFADPSTTDTPPSSGEHAEKVFGTFARHPFTAATGLAENALSSVTTGIGSLADAVTLSEPGTHDWGYRPRTEAGRELAAEAGEESAAIGRAYDRVPGADTPLGQTIRRYGPEALGATGTVAGIGGVAKGFGRGIAPDAIPATAEEALNAQRANSPQSMGAAVAAQDLSGTSPEFRSAVVRGAQSTGGALNPNAVARHVEAETLPVPIRLTEGQALQDPGLISEEQNLRGRQEDLRNRFDDQNQGLKQNITALRDRIGPDVFGTNAVDHGESLIQSYKNQDAPIRDEIRSAYEALKDANAGSFPVDGKTFVNNADAELKREYKAPFLPSGVQSILSGLRDGEPMTFENFENLRTTLAAEARKADRSGDGNASAAVNLTRQALEDLPMAKGATAEAKELANRARGLARDRFEAMRQDPAYDAAVNDKVDADDFVRKFVLNGKRDNVARMADFLGNDPQARQTIAVAALDHLRQSAGIDPMGNGNFSQAGFNKALVNLDPKLRSLVDPRTAEDLSKLGNVARNTQFQPRGSYVNNSNTFVSAAAEHAKGAVEGAVNLKAGGVPVGTWGRNFFQKSAEARRVQRALAPGAGITRLQSPGTTP